MACLSRSHHRQVQNHQQRLRAGVSLGCMRWMSGLLQLVAAKVANTAKVANVTQVSLAAGQLCCLGLQA